LAAAANRLRCECVVAAAGGDGGRRAAPPANRELFAGVDQRYNTALVVLPATGATIAVFIIFSNHNSQPGASMAVERTLSIIKPDAVAKNVIGEILSRFESNGLTIVAAQMRQLSREEAEGFYAVHKERPFFNDLVGFMTSGPVMIQVLEGDNAISKNRDLMGATNPADAATGTIRADFAETIDANAVHGSDAPDTAAKEIEFFFGNGGL